MPELLTEPLPPRMRAWCMAAAMACLLPLLLQVPPLLAVGLAVVATIGTTVSRPLPVMVRLAMLVTLMGYVMVSHGFSIGRDAGCALLAALLALKPFETHRLRDARSLLGFSMFAPFAAFLQDQGPLALALALPAAALLLLALALLAEQRPGAAAPRVDRRLAGAVALAVAMALPLAMAGFWLFPRLSSPIWGLPENALGRSGLGDRMTPDEWVDLFSDDTPALRVRFDGADPARKDLYWRGEVLWEFDGQTWSRGQVAVPLSSPAPVRPTRAAPVRYEVSMEPTDRLYLVTLDLPMEAPDGGQLRTDYTVQADAPVSQLIKYTGLSSVDAREASTLTPEQSRLALSLPSGLNPRMRALAQSWREEAGGDDAAVVRRAMAWIDQDFSYSLDVQPSGRNAVDDFLFDTQVGFCQHFSSAFANLMRAAGIPSRVVLGYAGGYRNRFGEYWVVRKMDAHAWAEVWLPGQGWVRVDPTAAVRPERVLDTVEDLARSESLLPSNFAPLLDLGDWARRNWNDLVLGFNAARQASLLRPLGIDQASGAQLSAAFAVGAGLALGLTLWVLMRGRRKPRDPVDAAWLAFIRRLRRADLAKHPHEPPLSYGERLAAAIPGHAGRLRSLSRRYASWRYAQAGLPAEDASRLVADLRAYRPEADPDPDPDADSSGERP
jgi:transglutaminase-like putative cysteine protease